MFRLIKKLINLALICLALYGLYLGAKWFFAKMADVGTIERGNQSAVFVLKDYQV